MLSFQDYALSPKKNLDVIPYKSFVCKYLPRVRSARENLGPRPCRIDRAIARPIWQVRGFDVNELFTVFYSPTFIFMLRCIKVWKKWLISGVSQAGTLKIRPTRYLGGRVGRSPLRGSAENSARMNYFRAKPEFIISDYIIARETAQPAIKYPLLRWFPHNIRAIMAKVKYQKSIIAW